VVTGRLYMNTRAPGQWPVSVLLTSGPTLLQCASGCVDSKSVPTKLTCTSPASSTDSSWKTGPCCESDCSCCTAGESSMSNWKVSGERMKSAAACCFPTEQHNSQLLVAHNCSMPSCSETQQARYTNILVVVCAVAGS
jgi:hypothetical protein